MRDVVSFQGATLLASLETMRWETRNKQGYASVRILEAPRIGDDWILVNVRPLLCFAIDAMLDLHNIAEPTVAHGVHNNADNHLPHS